MIALALVAGLAGLVYGFSGFGSALIAVPLYAALAGPETAVGLMAVTALASVVSVLPQAIRQADRRAALTILVPSLLCLPLGARVLTLADPVAIRWAMSLTVLGTLAALMAGLRYRGRAGPPAWIGVGALSGLMGGATGLAGPALVLFQLAGPDGAARMRANAILVLTPSSLALVPVLWWQGAIGPGEIGTGLLLAPIYGLTSWLGQRLFGEGREAIYRRVAYGIIAAAGLAGLPLFG